MPTDFLAPHTLVLQTDPERLLLYQSLLRQGVSTNLEGLAALFTYLDNPRSETLQKRVFCRDVTAFSLANCLLDNPAGIRLEDEALEPATLAVFIELLRARALLVVDCSYQDRVGKTQSLFDREHTGNFHQQIGHFLFEGGRRNASRWWIDQKFKADLSGPRDTPYLWVQNRFIEGFVSDNLEGQKWLDFGCGIGFYSALFAEKGADVLGVDPSEHYIDIARKHFSNVGRTEFSVCTFKAPTDFAWFQDRRFDRIFLCDVFLYYFEPYEALDLTPADLLFELRKLLRPEGAIYIVDPHGCFHLQPWLGVMSPVLLCSEYKTRKYRVAPSLEEVSRAAEDAGLSIVKIRELTFGGPETGEQSRNVVREFPMWWFFELATRN